MVSILLMLGLRHILKIHLTEIDFSYVSVSQTKKRFELSNCLNMANMNKDMARENLPFKQGPL